MSPGELACQSPTPNEEKSTSGYSVGGPNEQSIPQAPSTRNSIAMSHDDRLQQASDQGDAEAQFFLGAAYLEGNDVEQDIARAAALLQQAADQGHARAECKLGKVVALYQQAAEGGHADAQWRLAMLYLEGNGVQQDSGRAAALYQQAADQGDSEAQFSLGILYQEGNGLPQDSAKAAALYQQAADQGHVKAQFSLGVLYQGGIGVSQDSARAAALYQQAADQGQAGAQCSLGMLYQDGNGVQQDSARAATLYQQAADQENARAQCKLGLLYQDGHGVPQDSARAATLLRQAADQGNTEAVNYLQHKRLEAEAKAAAMAEELIRDEEEQASSTKGKHSKKKKKKTKGKSNNQAAQVKLPLTRTCHSILVWQAEAAVAEASPRPTVNTTASPGAVVGNSLGESTEERSIANEALQQAMATGQVEQLSAALLLHTAACPDLLTEARALRNQLRHRSKKQRLKAKKVIASMEALQRATDDGTDIDALVVAIGIAERVSVGADSRPELDKLLSAAHAQLERAREEETAAQKAAAIETVESEFVALAIRDTGETRGACAEEEQFSILDDVYDEASCVVCLSEKKEICLVPCGHVCVCWSCSEAIFSQAERSCPVCRCVIEAKCKVYL